MLLGHLALRCRRSGSRTSGYLNVDLSVGCAHTGRAANRTRPRQAARGRSVVNRSFEGAARVTGVPHVQAVPDWVARPLVEVVWMEHALLWTYVERGKSPEVHGARCALAWVGGVLPATPATGEAAAATEYRASAELIMCGSVSRGDPYPEPVWWRESGLQRFDTDERRRWWRSWSGFGWNRAIAEGAGLALAWALSASEDRVPVLPRRLEDGSLMDAAVQAECVAAIEEALSRPLPIAGVQRPVPASQ